MHVHMLCVCNVATVYVLIRLYSHAYHEATTQEHMIQYGAWHSDVHLCTIVSMLHTLPLQLGQLSVSHNVVLITKSMHNINLFYSELDLQVDNQLYCLKCLEDGRHNQ